MTVSHVPNWRRRYRVGRFAWDRTLRTSEPRRRNLPSFQLRTRL